ncbi:MAG: hypothetical protein LBE92_21425 [Chryseobacterium sp.]|jgi:hypothetical protein|uniref:hypothetical protein n=1 Tax=Chryseobacterium sp. TaxID=1871047 RepID=UPI002831043C|nr:hypothetical protein [Chryseobacterium sp.]MDR2238683.1 hypothetical protein [Chryseobacterium sp.]
MKKFLFFLMLLSCGLFLLGCEYKVKGNGSSAKGNSEKKVLKNVKNFDEKTKTIHVLVALCDNKYQGIVPVPEKIGNGQDPDQNLYWGAAYGVRTYFKKSKEWKDWFFRILPIKTIIW